MVFIPLSLRSTVIIFCKINPLSICVFPCLFLLSRILYFTICGVYFWGFIDLFTFEFDRLISSNKPKRFGSFAEALTRSLFSLPWSMSIMLYVNAYSMLMHIHECFCVVLVVFWVLTRVLAELYKMVCDRNETDLDIGIPAVLLPKDAGSKLRSLLSSGEGNFLRLLLFTVLCHIPVSMHMPTFL